MTQLLRYDAARQALAEARSVDDVLEIRDRVEALRIYARQVHDRDAEIYLTDIRIRAERRIGEIKRELRAEGLLQERGKPAKSADEADLQKVRLSDYGIDEKLSIRAERLAGYEPDAYERLMARWRERVAAERGRVSVNILKEEDDDKARQARMARVYEGGDVDDLNKLIAEGRKFKAILADPPWHFMTRSEKGDGRSAGQHYVTDSGNKMFDLPVADLADDDCVLFMWMVDWAPDLAFDLIRKWGFTHKTTAFTWVKQTKSADAYFMGQGYWTRANPESCWLATRGHPKRVGRDVRQLIVSPIREHSRKPDIVHDQIERLVDGPYLELFARHERDKWQTWGNELAFEMLDVPAHDLETGEIHELDGEGARLRNDAREAGEPVLGNGAPLSSSPSNPDDDIDIPAFLRRDSPECIVREEVR